MRSPIRRTSSAISIRQHKSAGFSLLEIMIVVVIIGVLVSIFSLSLGSFSDDATMEHARRLEALLDLAAEEASMQGREIGLRFYQHGYEFSARVLDVDEDGLQVWVWQPLVDDKLLKPRELGEDFYVDLIIEAKEVDLEFDAEEYAPENPQDYEPQIFLFSSGDLAPPFSARFRPAFTDEAVLVTADVEGKIDVELDDF